MVKSTLSKRKQPQTPLFKAMADRPYAIEERKTDELVIGMIGAIGAGVTTTAQIIEELLKKEFGYSLGAQLKVSEKINESATLVGLQEVSKNDSKRINKLQDIGTALRKKFGPQYLADKCIESINISRRDTGSENKPRRYFTIIDSLKNTEEITRLRKVYGENFWLFGVFAPRDTRKRRNPTLGNNPAYAETVLQTDEHEGTDHGQMVREAMQMADFFIRNDQDNTDTLKRTVERFLDILFGTKLITPNQDETAMFEAMNCATGSACLSRQVGAVIVSANGDIIGHGTNDVPKFGGGLYHSSDEEKDHRCYKWKDKCCHNDRQKSNLFKSASASLASASLIAKAKTPDAEGVIASTGFKGLIEFSRSVHAEMEAILSVARMAKSGLVNSTLYSTTYPCHNCARHIVASGIKRVVFIEPYAKSLALQLHSDAISESSSDQEKVQFLQYEGVAPSNSLRLFKDRGARKKQGQFEPTLRSVARPASVGMLDGLNTREQLVVGNLHSQENPSN